MNDRLSALNPVRRVLSADFAGDEADFGRVGTTVVAWQARPRRRRFPLAAGQPRLMIGSMGVGSVVSCTTDRLDWARQNLAQLDRDDLFSVPVLARIHELAQLDGQAVHGPHLFYVGSAETIHPVRGPADLTIDLVDQDRLPALYAHDGFHHALNYRGDEERPDVLAAVATDADVIVGIAAASADSDDRWQIGLDVQPDYRGRRLGQALTARLAAEILARGKTPYYATRPANIASRNVAVGAGFRPCWIEANTQ